METSDGLFCGGVNEATYRPNGGDRILKLELTEIVFDIEIFSQGREE